MRNYIIPLALSQIADFISTALAFTVGGYEINPIANLLLTYGGLPLWAMLKLVIILIAVLVMENGLRFGGRLLKISTVTITLITVFTFLISGWNTLVVFTQWML